MSFLKCPPHEIYHKIYHTIYDGCVDELMGLFRHVQEHVPVYDDHGDMYKQPMTHTASMRFHTTHLKDL